MAAILTSAAETKEQTGNEMRYISIYCLNSWFALSRNKKIIGKPFIV